eukprot:TRINITY_DN2767_c0_g1_i2.p1 TRINITY_DN2767_c0_g1~~TRINITY_DN2767_c0_g1_i2.p1  ORF type:complete len:228 (+),score=22.23 TRINITY_DN2767_c0_g1_i2:512-1195(+)
MLEMHRKRGFHDKERSRILQTVCRGLTVLYNHEKGCDKLPLYLPAHWAAVVVGNKEAEALKTEAEKFSKSAGFCCVCGKAIGVGMYVNLDGGLYHEECFLCIECGTPITDKLFESKPDGPVCRTCSSAARAGAETEAACSACNKPLSGKVINAAEGRHYHEVCFVCTTCRKPIAGAFAEVDSKPVCSACAQARSGTMSSSFVTHAVVTGERKPGMRVDPRSGKRTFV